MGTKEYGWSRLRLLAATLALAGTAPVWAYSADCGELTAAASFTRAELDFHAGADIDGRHESQFVVTGYPDCSIEFRDESNAFLRCTRLFPSNVEAIQHLETIHKCLDDIINMKEVRYYRFEDGYRATRLNGRILLSEPRTQLTAARADYVTLTARLNFAWQGRFELTFWYRYQ
ncbi:MAG: hypothetical protein JJT93_14180 [Gammaproteobacteria bacterium]|nr:hypothetical protein [Gammaproteobacteria bacterium]